MADLVCKPGTKSIVWHYFSLKKDSDGSVVDNGHCVCRSCRKTVTAKHGNTSNLLAHIRVHYSKLHCEVTALMKSGKTAKGSRTSPLPQQPTLPAVVETIQPYEKKREAVERTYRLSYIFFS